MADRAYQRRDLCGEVIDRIHSELQTKTTASEMTLARFLARKAIKTEWRKPGVKVLYIDGKDLNIAAWAYLHEHLEELIGEAKLTLAEWESSPRYRNFVESSATAQDRKPRKTDTMTELASTGIVESTVTDPQRRKDFLDPTEIKTLLEAAPHCQEAPLLPLPM